MVEQRYTKLSDFVTKEQKRIYTKKEVIQRNYELLEVAMDVIPISILSCEEGLLSGMLMANQNLLKIVKVQEKKMKSRYQMVDAVDADAEKQDKVEGVEQSKDPFFGLVDREG